MKSPRSGRWNWKCSETELARRRSRMTRDAVGARAVTVCLELWTTVRVTVFSTVCRLIPPGKTKSGDSDANERHMRFAPEVLPFRRMVTTNRDTRDPARDMPRARPAHRPRAATRARVVVRIARPMARALSPLRAPTYHCTIYEATSPPALTRRRPLKGREARSTRRRHRQCHRRRRL